MNKTDKVYIYHAYANQQTEINYLIHCNENLQDQLQIVHSFHEMGETIAAAQFLIENTDYTLISRFELREKPNLNSSMTTEGALGEPQIIRIPDNTFESASFNAQLTPMR
jgi:hypothetical protein